MSSQARKIIKLSSLLLVMSWYSRVLGIFSIIILARYLDKNDFGIIAGCFVVQAFFHSISNVGSGSYLIRKKEILEHDLNAAWTIGFFSKTLIAISIFFLSDQAAKLMQIPELEYALKVMSLSAFFIGCTNPAINIDIKRLDYSKLMLLEMVSKTISTSFSIYIAITYKTYWAVVVAEVVYQCIYSFGSHLIRHYRPKFIINNVREQWDFSKWVLLKGIFVYLKYSFDRIVVSRSYSVGELGLYNFSLESSSTVVSFLITPISQILYPGLAEYADDKFALVDKAYKVMLTLVCIYLPILFGGIYLSDLIVPLVFGEKWIEAIGLFDIFLSLTFSEILITILANIFTLSGEVKRQFIYDLVTSLIFLIIMLSISFLSLEFFAIGRVLLSYFSLIALVFVLKVVIPISFLNIIKLITPPLLSSVIMIFALDQISPLLTGYSDVIVLVTLIGLGVLFYFSTILAFIITLKSRVDAYNFLYETFFLPVYSLLVKRVLYYL